MAYKHKHTQAVADSITTTTEEQSTKATTKQKKKELSAMHSFFLMYVLSYVLAVVVTGPSPSIPHKSVNKHFA